MTCRHLLALALLAGFASPDALAQGITVGAASTTSDAPIYIADRKGFFRAEGLDVKVTNFRSASDMVAPLGAGQLDAGAGSAGAPTRPRRRRATAQPKSWCARISSTAGAIRRPRTSKACASP
jgi:ABC-type nitrate/sulfonate/bicarbonate transport system substrate-binding protein